MSAQLTRWTGHAGLCPRWKWFTGSWLFLPCLLSTTPLSSVDQTRDATLQPFPPSQRNTGHRAGRCLSPFVSFGCLWRGRGRSDITARGPWGGLDLGFVWLVEWWPIAPELMWILLLNYLYMYMYMYELSTCNYMYTYRNTRLYIYFDSPKLIMCSHAV